DRYLSEQVPESDDDEERQDRHGGESRDDAGHSLIVQGCGGSIKDGRTRTSQCAIRNPQPRKTLHAILAAWDESRWWRLSMAWSAGESSALTCIVAATGRSDGPMARCCARRGGSPESWTGAALPRVTVWCCGATTARSGQRRFSVACCAVRSSCRWIAAR